MKVERDVNKLVTVVLDDVACKGICNNLLLTTLLSKIDDTDGVIDREFVVKMFLKS